MYNCQQADIMTAYICVTLNLRPIMGQMSPPRSGSFLDKSFGIR